MANVDVLVGNEEDLQKGLGILGPEVSAKSKLDESNESGHCHDGNFCDQTGVDLRSDSKSAALVSTLGFVAGAALIGGGAALWLTAPPPFAAPAKSVSIPVSFTLPAGAVHEVSGVKEGIAAGIACGWK